MDRPRLYVDFNELLAPDLVLLSREDSKPDSNGEVVNLREGLAVFIYSDDLDAAGNPDNLIADGVVERNSSGRAVHVKWCCRIGPNGIRNESELND